MKNVMIAFAFIATVALASCGGKTVESTETPACDTTCVDSCKVDTTAVAVDTTATK